MGLIDHFGHGVGPPVAPGSGELTGREPGGLIPDPWLEPGIEVSELPFEASLAVARHTGCADGGAIKTRGPPWGRNSTAVPSIAYTWRGRNTDTLVHNDLCARAPHQTPEDGMATKLDKTIKRELELDGKLYTVAISPEGVKVTPKGARKGQEISWSSIVSGETELRRDLNASVDAYRE